MVLDWNHLQQKWQKQWADAGLGKAAADKNKEKFFMIFAYPGISGFLHVGHMRGFSYTDAICRYERLKGKEVLFPVGTHASGNQAISFANKVKNNDEDWIKYLLNNGCPKNKIKELASPEKIIEYFNQVYVNDYWKKFGFICDWNRFICTTYPDYEKFIQWQFKKLQQHDLLTQKPYFATACVVHGPVAVDPSETDLSKGGNAEKNEYTLLKFKLEDDYLVAATLRPETIFGQTNLWINPEMQYVRVEVEDETWILSREAAEKLQHQKDDVLLKEDIQASELLGKYAAAAGIGREIIILPATFVDPHVGTGIVTSVPGDAPYDYVALRTLQENEPLCKAYGLDPKEIKKIGLYPIIKTKGFQEFPAKEIVEKLNIRSLSDPKLEDATKEVYKAGHHSGIMTSLCGKYAGKSVEEAKELVKAELIESGKGDVFHDLNEEVLCRCGNKVVIKRIDDQWFIRYSDAELTRKSKEHAGSMNVYPREYKENLPSILDWFSDRACTRLGNWMGSSFPFDEQWTIEPISDSTLYPAYYIVSGFINDGTISLQDLTEEFFDYVFLGQGEGKRKWEPIRKEFEYFYPLDLNLGGKEHQTVHFPVFIMNHVGILPQDKWPKGILVNWWVTGKGGKISKSKGGAEPIPQAMEKYGVDAMRLYYAHIGSPHVDVVWTEEMVLNYKNALERIHALTEDLRKVDGKNKSIDNWLWSRMHEHIKGCGRAMETYNLRELASTVYYAIYDDLKWYLRRGGENRKTVSEVMDMWAKLMNPITPHLSEEVNDSEGLVSASRWPKADEEKISKKAEAGEELVRTAMEGMRNVLLLAKLSQPKRFTLFVAERWLYGLVAMVAKEINVTRNTGEIMKRVLEEEEMKAKGKEISRVVISLVKDVTKIPSFVTSQGDETAVLYEAKKSLEKEFNCDVQIICAEDSDHPKAKSALPGKVGILAE